MPPAQSGSPLAPLPADKTPPMTWFSSALFSFRFRPKKRGGTKFLAGPFRFLSFVSAKSIFPTYLTQIVVFFLGTFCRAVTPPHLPRGWAGSSHCPFFHTTQSARELMLLAGRFSSCFVLFMVLVSRIFPPFVAFLVLGGVGGGSCLLPKI